MVRRYFFNPLLLLLLFIHGAGAGQLSLTPEERAWLAEHPLIRHAPDPDYAPFEWRDAQGRIVGIAPDYLALVGKKLGIRFETIASDSWKGSLDAVRERRADLVTVATKTPERAEYMRFTTPYATFPNVILMRADTSGQYDLPGLKGRTVAGLAGWAMTGLIEKEHPDIRLQMVGSVREALERVSVGRVDAVLLNLATAGYWIERLKITNLRIAGETRFTYQLSFASRKDWPLLDTLLQKAMAEISDAEQQALFGRWISLRDEGWRPGADFWIAAAGLILLLSVVAVLVWNRTLQRRVAESTEELRRAKERAEAADLAKTRFLANMSHEIRTPMNAVIGMCHLMTQTELSDKQRDYMEKIQLGSERLLGLIDNILDLFRLESGQLRLSPVTFYLDDLLEKLAVRLGPEAEDKNIELLFSHTLPPSFAFVGDANRLEQVLFNLIDNAIKFTRAGKVMVEVKVEAGEGHWRGLRFSVADTGIGLSTEEMERLFQPFFQVDASTTRRFGGAGMGLAVSRRLVALMDGHLSVESQPGRGSVFSFRIALEGGERQREAEVTGVELPQGLNLLVVDDHEAARTVFRVLLENLGTRVVLAESGEEALERLRDRGDDDRFDLILMDWRMPGLDGIDTARHIQSEWGDAAPPIVLVSAFGRERVLNAASGIRLAGVCQKPVTPTDLSTVLGRVVKGEGGGSDPSGSAGPEPPEAAVVAEVIPLLDALARDLAQGNARAVKRVPEIRERLGSCCRRLLERVTRQIENYDFEEAEETVAEVKRTLEPPGGED